MLSVVQWAGKNPLFAGLCVIAFGQGLMNASYGYQQWGGGNFTGPALTFGLIYLGVEWVKLAAAHELGRAWRQQQWLTLGATAVLVVATLYFSITAHMGFIGSYRNDQMAKREAAGDQRDTVREQLKAARAERARIGVVRAIQAIAAEEALECKSGVGPLCTKLRAEMASAQRAATLDTTIARLTDKRVATGAVGMADPQTAVLGWVYRAGEDDKKLLLTILGALAIEISTALGFMVVGGAAGSRQPETLAAMLAAGIISHPGAAAVVDFKRDVLEAQSGGSLSEDDVWLAYQRWCVVSKRGEIDRGAFLNLLQETPLRRRDGRFVGCVLRHAWFLKNAS